MDDGQAKVRAAIALECDWFAREVEMARGAAKKPLLFLRNPPKLPIDTDGEIRFLRRWNSHTPMFAGGWGGGYLVRWRGKGTVIDPGCTFLRAFNALTPYSLGDVHVIIVTHDHTDHCHDLVPLISLLREFNKWRLGEGLAPHGWDLVVSQGVHSQYQSLLHHPETSVFLTVRKLLAPEKADQVCELPDYLASPKTTANWPPHHRSWQAFHRSRRLSREYAYKLSATKTHHRELLGERTGFGVTLEFLRETGEESPVVVAFGGDTAVHPSKPGTRVTDFVRAWRRADVVVLHVGTMEKPRRRDDRDFDRLGEHLGIRGVSDILWGLRNSAHLKMVVLAEWGYEFGRLGLNGRTAFCELVQRRLEAKGCQGYYSLTSMTRPENGIPIIPCDIGLRVSLPQLQIWQCNPQEVFLPPAQVVAREVGEQILYEKV